MRDELEKARKILREGGVILYPTDTIWGLGCDATLPSAVERIYHIKKRSDTKSMLVLVDEAARVADYVEEVPPIAEQLVAVADTPLTIVYPGARNLATNLVNTDGSIGIRVTTDPFCKELIREFRKPIVSTSANLSGQPSPGNFDEIPEEIRRQVDYVVNWRQDEVTKAKPSSIIKLGLKGEIEILRK